MAWQDRYSIEAFRAAIKKLIFEDGLTSVQAAKVLGPDVTRNMVVRQRETLLGKKQTSTVTFPDSVWASTAKIPGEKAIEVPEVPVHLQKVKEGQCRAPLWPDFIRSTQKAPTSEHMMCGNKCMDGSTYCDEHHALFYPTEMQKRATPKSKTKRVDNAQHFR